MQVRTSKEVTDREKAGRLVLSVFSLQGEAIAAELDRRIRPHLPEGRDPDYRETLFGFAFAIRGRLKRLVEADEAHYAAKARHATLVRWRDRLVRRGARRIAGLRRTLVGLHQEPDLGRLGLEQETAQEAVPLLRQFDRIAEILGSDDYVEMLGATVFDDTPLDVASFRQQLVDDASALREAVRQVGLARRQAESAFLAKEEATREYDQMIVRAGRIFEDCCRLAGRSDLADRIRPSVRRRTASTEPPPEAPDETDPDPSDPDPVPDDDAV